MATNTQSHTATRRSAAKLAHRAPERTKGEAVTPVAVLHLIERVGVTAAHRMLGVSTTTLHKARKPGAVVSRVIELASEAKLREMQMQESGLAAEEARILAPAPTPPQRLAMPERKRLVIMEVPEHHADQLERIALAWGAEFTKA